MFKINCNFACWECPDDCEMKTMMKTLSETEFNSNIIENMKANAGKLQIQGALTPQQAHDFVVKNSVTLHIAREKYLETLQ